MKKSYQMNIVDYIAIILVVVVVLGFCWATYTCKNTANRFPVYYGNNDYCFVQCNVDAGRSTEMYFGVMTTEDYNHWVNGDRGTVFVLEPDGSNLGFRLNINSITSIVNNGSTPDWLPLNY